jgi:hypothetical protein
MAQRLKRAPSHQVGAPCSIRRPKSAPDGSQTFLEHVLGGG